MVSGQGGLSGIRRGGRTFGWLGLKVHPDRSSVRKISEDSFTEEVTVEGNAVFEGGLKFVASGSNNNFNSTDSADQGVIGERLERLFE